MIVFIIASALAFVASVFDYKTSSHRLILEHWFLYKDRDGKFSKGWYIVFNTIGYAGFLLFGVFTDNWIASAVVMFALTILRIILAVNNHKAVHRAIARGASKL